MLIPKVYDFNDFKVKRILFQNYSVLLIQKEVLLSKLIFTVSNI